MVVLGLVMFAAFVGFAVGYFVGDLHATKYFDEEISRETEHRMEQFDADRRAAYEYFRSRSL
jgi:membrane protein DedA with SNARE-associated domain